MRDRTLQCATRSRVCSSEHRAYSAVLIPGGARGQAVAASPAEIRSAGHRCEIGPFSARHDQESAHLNTAPTRQSSFRAAPGVRLLPPLRQRYEAPATDARSDPSVRDTIKSLLI